MSYPTIDPVEKEQVEQVFGLTGGELGGKPLRYAIVKCDPTRPGEFEIYRNWARYFYDGPPGYVERTWLRRGGDYFTIIGYFLFGQPPKRILVNGKLWRRVAVYRNSGEEQCPWKDVEQDEQPDPLTWKDGRCPLCEASIIDGEKHGHVDLGEGWAEVVYRSM